MLTEVSKRLFTADEFLRMAEVGILARGDRVELIDGEIVAMTPIGPGHGAAVDRANKALTMGVGDRAIVRVQGSVRLNLYRQPEPDLVLLRPRADFYASRLPGPGDILLIVEVAESSLEYDREVKARIYAESGVPEHWLADLNDRTLTCYADPRDGQHRSVRQCRRGESLAPALVPECVIPSDTLLI